MGTHSYLKYKWFIAPMISLLSAAAFALDIQDYDAAKFEASMRNNQTIVLDFKAWWCPTCIRQGRVLKSLKDDPRFKDIIVYQASYDNSEELKKKWGVQRQSTLILLNKNGEIARLVGVTDTDKIVAFLSQSSN